MNAMLPTAKRPLRRTRLYLQALLRDPTGQSEVLIRDISNAGALVESSTPPAVGSVVQLSSEDSVLDARVAWVDGTWFGIQFDQPLCGELLKHINATLKVSAPRAHLRDRPEPEIGEAH